MNRWFRVYDSLVDDPKVQRLSPDQFKGLVNLWCLACRNDGHLPSTGDIAFSLRTTAAKVEQLIVELQLVGLIEKDVTTGANQPHNWNGRQFKSDVTDPTAAIRNKQYRDRKRDRNADRNAHAPQITDTEAETERTRPSDETGASELEREFDRVFWPAYPHKIDKPAARKAWPKARSKASLAEIMAGLSRYTADKPADIQWKHPGPWLNAERWNDEPASPPPVNGQGRPEPANNAILAAFVRQSAQGAGEGREQALPDGFGDDNDTGSPGDLGKRIDLAPSGFRRTG